MIFISRKIIPTTFCALLLSAGSASALPSGYDAPGHGSQIRWQKMPEWQTNSGALDMVHFNMQLIQSAKTAPENANYNRIARNTGEALGTEDHSFDAKQ